MQGSLGERDSRSPPAGFDSVRQFQQKVSESERVGLSAPPKTVTGGSVQIHSQ
jgi:hypothetical protein